jgi:hypothetical protein
MVKNSFCSGIRVTRSLVLCMWFVHRCLSCRSFYFDQCFVSPSSISKFWLLLLVSSSASWSKPERVVLRHLWSLMTGCNPHVCLIAICIKFETHIGGSLEFHLKTMIYWVWSDIRGDYNRSSMTTNDAGLLVQACSKMRLKIPTVVIRIC